VNTVPTTLARLLPGRHPLTGTADDQPVFDEHPDELLDVQRIAPGRLDHPPAGVVGAAQVVEQVVHQNPALIGFQRLERQGGGEPPGTPARPFLP
jgi:hypothetical protein